MSDSKKQSSQINDSLMCEHCMKSWQSVTVSHLSTKTVTLKGDNETEIVCSKELLPDEVKVGDRMSVLVDLESAVLARRHKSTKMLLGEMLNDE